MEFQGVKEQEIKYCFLFEVNIREYVNDCYYLILFIKISKLMCFILRVEKLVENKEEVPLFHLMNYAVIIENTKSLKKQEQSIKESLDARIPTVSTFIKLQFYFYKYIYFLFYLYFLFLILVTFRNQRVHKSSHLDCQKILNYTNINSML